MEIFKHPRAWEAVLIARLLSMRIPREKRVDHIQWVYMLGLEEITAGNRPALSKLSYCVGCDTVITSDIAVPLVMHRCCSLCDHPDKPWGGRINPLYYDMTNRFLQYDPEVQILALEYLKEREQHGTTIRSDRIEDGQASDQASKGNAGQQQ